MIKSIIEFLTGKCQLSNNCKHHRKDKDYFCNNENHRNCGIYKRANIHPI